MKFLDKVWNTLGLFEYVETDEEEEKQKTVETSRPESISKYAEDTSFEREELPWLNKTANRAPASHGTSHASTNNVVSLPIANQQVKVMVVSPTVFDDAQAIADHVRAAKPVVVNFEKTEPEVMKRIVDFISGTVYALNGNIQLVGNSIMVCAPNNVDIDANKTFLSSKDFEPWRQ